MRVFRGVSAARIGQNLSGLFASPGGAASSGYTVNSLFTGAGPRVGIKGQFGIGDFQFIGEMAGAVLIGTAQTRMDFTTLSPAFGLSSQYITSPNATRVVPSIDGRLATAYSFAPTAYGLFKVEAGYKAAVYFDAVNSYELTQVPTSLTLPPIGIYLATQQHLLSNFIVAWKSPPLPALTTARTHRLTSHEGQPGKRATQRWGPKRSVPSTAAACDNE